MYPPAAVQFDLPINKGTHYVVGTLSTAWDWDHQNDADPTMIYTLRDGDADVVDGDQDEDGDADADARFFRTRRTGGQIELLTHTGFAPTHVGQTFSLKLVACDGNFKRGYIPIIITITEDDGEGNNNNNNNNQNNDNQNNDNNNENNNENNQNNNNQNNNNQINNNNQNNNNNNNNGNSNIGGGNNGADNGANNNDDDVNTRNIRNAGFVRDGSQDPSQVSRPIIRSFPENSPPGQDIGEPVTLPSDDDVVLSYTLEGPDARSFRIDRSDGQLKTRHGVIYDYETRSSYSVRVVATAPDGTRYVAVVTILVIDVPEDPAFADFSVTRSFPENALPGHDIGLPVTATDGDGDSLTYTLEGADAASFDIVASSGQIRTRAGVVYDYETRRLYSVVVRATDPPGASAVIAVAIHVTDVPEDPAFPSPSTTRSFPENTPPGRNIGLPVTATDGDGDILTYTLEGADAASFDIRPSNGQIVTRAGVIYDYETRSSYTVLVRATDPSRANAAIVVDINVTDVPEGPLFAGAETTRSFPENTPPGHDIGAPVTAIDGDGDVLTYSLEGADAAAFDIVASSGQIMTRAGVTYDYETRTRYSVIVRATDPSRAAVTIVVAIHLTDLPEKPATPAAPRLWAVDGTTTALHVRWRAPDRNGGPPLTGYDVEYRQGDRGTWRPWPHSGLRTVTTLRGLSGSTGYQARVRALNGEVPSDWSPPGSGRTNATIDGWLARFGRTVAQQMLQGVELRLQSPRQSGLHGTVAGRPFGGEMPAMPPGGAYHPARRDGSGASSLWGAGLETDPFLASHAHAQPELLMHSAFQLNTEDTAGGGKAGVWGLGGHAGFGGLEDGFELDGDVTTGTLGADYARGPWTAGLALSHSRGVGGYGRAYSVDDVEAWLTGLYPYAGLKLGNRISLWTVGGYGQGSLTLLPDDSAAMETDIDLAMAALGGRGVLLGANGTNGFSLALETEAFWVRATSEAVPGLLAADVQVGRLRLGLEGSYTRVLANGGLLVPKFELGLRHDDGDAETGLGMDIGGGLTWSHPSRAVFVQLEARSIAAHQADGFHDWSVSGMVRYDPNPHSDRGLSAQLLSSVGSSSLPGDAVLAEPSTLAAAHGERLVAEAAYGFPILAGRMTGAPWVGVGVLENGRDYRAGYRVSPARQTDANLTLGIEGVRRESANAEADHAVGLRFAMRW